MGSIMKVARRKTVLVAFVVSFVGCVAALSWAYPPGVGITSKSRTCNSCHVNSGPWHDDIGLIVDILDARSRESLRQPDGGFLISVPRGQKRGVITVLGRTDEDTSASPRRNGWAYVDPTQIVSTSLSKFAPGWDVDLPMSCRSVGDTIQTYAGDHVTVLPMTLRPGDGARAADVELQFMLTSGDSVKGKAREGLSSNYFMRRVRLEVTD